MATGIIKIGLGNNMNLLELIEEYKAYYENVGQEEADAFLDGVTEDEELKKHIRACFKPVLIDDLCSEWYDKEKEIRNIDIEKEILNRISKGEIDPKNTNQLVKATIDITLDRVSSLFWLDQLNHNSVVVIDPKNKRKGEMTSTYICTNSYTPPKSRKTIIKEIHKAIAALKCR